MSKLYKTYLALKKQDSQTIYLFKSGIFYIAIDEDAQTLSNIFNFKLGNLNDNIIKCGFPCSSFDKYYNLFTAHNLSVKIVESDNIYKLNEFKQNTSILELLDFINAIDTNNLSITETYKILEILKEKVSKINNKK